MSVVVEVVKKARLVEHRGKDEEASARVDNMIVLLYLDNNSK